MLLLLHQDLKLHLAVLPLGLLLKRASPRKPMHVRATFLVDHVPEKVVKRTRAKGTWLDHPKGLSQENPAMPTTATRHTYVFLWGLRSRMGAVASVSGLESIPMVDHHHQRSVEP